MIVQASMLARGATLFALRLFFGIYVASSLLAMWVLAWRQPAFDQYRLYETFLTLDFPHNVIQSENGHRPIIPNLLRVAEIAWFDGSQMLQIGIGICLVLLLVGTLAAVVWRDIPRDPVARWCGLLSVALGILWFANARMLLHGNELVHAYLVVVMVTCAILLTYQAAQLASFWAYAWASLACAIAMFSFGPGIAGFPTILALGILLRLPLRWHLLPVAMLGMCLTVYLLFLPGGSGAVSTLEFEPIQTLLTLCRWIASPWANAWLGLASPPLTDWLPAHMARNPVGLVLVSSATRITAVTGIEWSILVAIIGAVGVIALLSRLVHCYFHPGQLTRLGAIALGFGIFAFATGAMISMARLDEFAAQPAQVYADRYLMWPCLFWMGLFLSFLPHGSQSKGNWQRKMCIVSSLVLALFLLPTHYSWAAWGGTVYERLQASAAAARADVFDAAVFPVAPDASRETVFHTLKLLRQNHLAMFAEPGWKALGSKVHLAPTSIGLSANVALSYAGVDERNGSRYARFDGAIRGSAEALENGLVVTDELGTVVGFAELGLPMLAGGFRVLGYVGNYDPGRYYILGIQTSAGIVAELATVLPRQ